MWLSKQAVLHNVNSVTVRIVCEHKARQLTSAQGWVTTIVIKLTMLGAFGEKGHIFPPSSFFFGGVLGLTLVRQALYQLSHTHSFLILVII
jgi:hypothetical protein